MLGMRIVGLTIEGFKSFWKNQYIPILPLTILAGANSSGKSSSMQPLLLLKQTLEAPYDPGPLKIDGPIVAFSRTSQMFTNRNGKASAPKLRIGLDYELPKEIQRSIDLTFEQEGGGLLTLAQESIRDIPMQNTNGTVKEIDLAEGEIPLEEIWNNAWLEESLSFFKRQEEAQVETRYDYGNARIIRSSCFLDLELQFFKDGMKRMGFGVPISQQTAPMITNVMHVPGLRDPALSRSYPLMPIGERFPGSMHSYLASIIHNWGSGSDKLNILEQELRSLGLTGKVEVQPIDDTALEVLVGRYVPSSQEALDDLVSIADVGLGLSQIMPVLVALGAAQTNQLVVIEQPELHLHPRCIHRLAEILVGAVNRGVHMVVETHSELLLLGIQTLVAAGELDPKKVSLNWFSLDEEGATRIDRAELANDGSFGDWPIDFLDVAMDARKSYLDATWMT